MFGLKAFDMILIIANVILFIIIQTGFFVKVGSTQYITTLVSKLQPIKDFIGLNETSSDALKKYMGSAEWTLEKSKIEEETMERQAQAKEYLIKNLKIPLIISLGILGYFVMQYRNDVKPGNDDWSKTKLFLLMGVLLAYSSEILSYRFVMSQWEHVASLRLLKDIVL